MVSRTETKVEIRGKIHSTPPSRRLDSTLRLLPALCLLLVTAAPLAPSLEAQSVSVNNAEATSATKTQAKKSGGSKSTATKRRRSRGRWYTERSYANSPAGDFTAGEDPLVRRAAVEALGKFNGSVVVVDARSGRILTAVNQKLALASGYTPCSTIKLVVGLAALNEGIVRPRQKVWFDGYWFMTMVNGLAISNNVYFEHLGKKLGFDRFKRYANQYGFGEKAGLGIPGEQLGEFPKEEIRSGVERMSSFGEGIRATPLQMAAFIAALANGGTLYYLQAPRGPNEAAALEPRVKRRVPGARWLPEIHEGMLEAVKRGTGRKARSAKRVLYGKTGTCSQYHRPGRTQLGWFACFNEVNQDQEKQLAVVVMLRGGPMMYGPRAAEIAGNIYQSLDESRYFTSSPSPAELVSLGPADCCAP